MRIFTAIPLPKANKEKISEITRRQLPVPYINTSNLHLTLNFFGELTDTQTERVKELMKGYEFPKKFKIEFDKLSRFRNQIHITIKNNLSLKTLQAQLEHAFEQAGFDLQKRSYYPHVKLANMHMDKVMNKNRKIENFDNTKLTELSFVADKVVLYESKLLLHHAHYTPLEEYGLR